MNKEKDVAEGNEKKRDASLRVGTHSYYANERMAGGRITRTKLVRRTFFGIAYTCADTRGRPTVYNSFSRKQYKRIFFSVNLLFYSPTTNASSGKVVISKLTQILTRCTNKSRFSVTLPK